MLQQIKNCMTSKETVIKYYLHGWDVSLIISRDIEALIVLTSDRVIIATKVDNGILFKDTTYQTKDLLYEDISGINVVQVKNIWGTGQGVGLLQKGVEGEMVFPDLTKEQQDEAVAAIKEKMEEAKEKKKAAAQPAPAPAASVNVVEELKGLKNLLDMGVLTQEEFDSSKAKLLAKL